MRAARCAAIAGLLVLGVCSCSSVRLGPDEGPTNVAENPQVPVPAWSAMHLQIATVDQGLRSGIRSPRQVVIRDQSAWEELWAMHAAGGTHPRIPLSLPLESHTVLAVFLGERPSSGYAVCITSVTEKDGVLEVVADETVPSSVDMQFPVVLTPYHIVMVPGAYDAASFTLLQVSEPRRK